MSNEELIEMAREYLGDVESEWDADPIIKALADALEKAKARIEDLEAHLERLAT